MNDQDRIEFILGCGTVTAMFVIIVVSYYLKG